MQSSKPTPAHRRKLGYVIRAHRDAIGVSQEQLAEYADCHRNYIGLVERGEQNLTVESLLKLSKALKAKPSDILREAGL